VLFIVLAGRACQSKARSTARSKTILARSIITVPEEYVISPEQSAKTEYAMPNATTFLSRCLLAVLVFSLAACSSYQTVSVEQGLQQGSPPGVDFGSLVKVTTLDRKTDTFRVTEINADGLGGNTGFYRYDNMKSLKVDRSQQKKGERTALAWSLIGLAALIALIANADSVSVCSPPCSEP
jgi:hypothetical protein